MIDGEISSGKKSIGILNFSLPNSLFIHGIVINIESELNCDIREKGKIKSPISESAL